MKARFVPSSAAVSERYADSQCSPQITITYGDARILMDVACGEHSLESMALERAKSMAVEGIGSISSHRGADLKTYVYGWDHDVPCHVGLTWHAPNNPKQDEQATELAKEVLKRLTPESIARPRAELVVAAVDDTGEKARRELARWETKRAAVSTLMTLAPGYPRIARGDEFADGPKGKHFLLFGICPSQQGQNMASVLQGVYPPEGADTSVGVGAEHFNVDGAGLPADCPPEVTALYPRELGNGYAFAPQPDGRLITVAGLLDARVQPGQPHARVAAFLLSKERDVLDVKTTVVPMPVDGMAKGRFLPETMKRHAKCMALASNVGPVGRHAYKCEVYWGDYLCRGRKETETLLHTFRATDDNKLDMTASTMQGAGSLCQAPE